MDRRDKAICRIWDIVCGDHPHNTTEWHIETTKLLFRSEYRETIHASDIMDALETRERYR